MEGVGDVQSFPTLVTKTAALFGMTLFAPNPIPAKGYANLSRPGQLERFAEMAASRPEATRVIIAVDLDDGCVVEAQQEFLRRCAPIAEKYKKPITICFAVREYECWFLENLDSLRQSAPEYGWLDADVKSAHEIRGAKEALQRVMKKHYKESSDQSNLTRRLDIGSLAQKSRSFRKFVKCITDMDYAQIDEQLKEAA